MKWTDKQIAVLRKMHAAGSIPADIATALADHHGRDYSLRDTIGKIVTLGLTPLADFVPAADENPDAELALREKIRAEVRLEVAADMIRMAQEIDDRYSMNTCCRECREWTVNINAVPAHQMVNDIMDYLGVPEWDWNDEDEEGAEDN